MSLRKPKSVRLEELRARRAKRAMLEAIPLRFELKKLAEGAKMPKYGYMYHIQNGDSKNAKTRAETFITRALDSKMTMKFYKANYGQNYDHTVTRECWVAIPIAEEAENEYGQVHP